MDSMMNILPEHKLLISDVRQNGSGPLLRELVDVMTVLA